MRSTTLSLGVLFFNSAYFIPFGSTPKMMFGSTGTSLAAKFHALAASLCGLTAAVAATFAGASLAQAGAVVATRKTKGDSAVEARRTKDLVIGQMWPPPFGRSSRCYATRPMLSTDDVFSRPAAFAA